MPSRRLLSVTLAVALLAGLAGAVTTPAAALNDPLFERQWGLQVIGAKSAWDAGLLGDGIDIAVVDSGLHLGHQEFTGRIAAGRNYIQPGAPAQDDDCEGGPDPDGTCRNGGHGTHVAGIAAAGIDNGGSVGVAPKARIMPVKVLGPDGSGTFADAADGIRWATDNGAEVINLSLGSDTQGLSGTPSSLNQAVSYAWSKGVICVFAAGNSFVLGSGFRDQPALVVSATNRDDGKPDFSSGVGEAKWALSAPGGGNTVQIEDDENILSTVWVADNRRDTYAEKRGTSMSAPFVAGAAAVLRGAGLTPEQTVEALLTTTKDLGVRGRDGTFGEGRLDLAKAVQRVPPRSTTPTTATAPPPAGSSSTTSQPPVAEARPARTTPDPARPAVTSPPPPDPTPPPDDDPDATGAEVVTAPEVVPADPDDGFLALDEPRDDADDAVGTASSSDDDREASWPWVLLAGLAALGVGGVTGRLLWRRRTATTDERTGADGQAEPSPPTRRRWRAR